MAACVDVGRKRKNRSLLPRLSETDRSPLPGYTAATDCPAAHVSVWLAVLLLRLGAVASWLAVPGQERFPFLVLVL